MTFKHRLGWPRKKQHLTQLEVTARTVVNFHHIWGWKWAIGALRDILWGIHLKKKWQEERRWKKWQMYRGRK